jgi:hypothetical protein
LVDIDARKRWLLLAEKNDDSYPMIEKLSQKMNPQKKRTTLYKGGTGEGSISCDAITQISIQNS